MGRYLNDLGGLCLVFALGYVAVYGDTGGEPLTCQICSCKEVYGWQIAQNVATGLMNQENQQILNGLQVQAVTCGDFPKLCILTNKARRYEVSTFTPLCLGRPNSNVPIQTAPLTGMPEVKEEVNIGECVAQNAQCPE